MKRYQSLKEENYEPLLDKLTREVIKLVIIHDMDYEDGQYSSESYLNNGKAYVKGNYLYIKDNKVTMNFNVNKIKNFTEKDRYYTIELKNLKLDVYL